MRCMCSSDWASRDCDFTPRPSCPADSSARSGPPDRRRTRTASDTPLPPPGYSACTQETLQQPCPGEPPDRVDSLEEGLPIPSERPVRFRAKPIERHVHVHSAHIDQLGDAVVTQIGAVRTNTDIHLRPSKGANQIGR